MDYKERIEAAKEQLKAADAVEYKLPDSAHAIRTAVYAIFPELRESEDEKVRKWLIDWANTVHWSEQFSVTKEQVLAWLEKQGNLPIFKASDWCVSNVDGKIHKITTDKVKPKFKVGDWVVWQNKCYKVNYNGCGYELIDQNGLSTSLEYGTVDKSAYSWSIKDAKEKDVLIDFCEDLERPLIFMLKKFESVYFGLAKKSDYSSYCFLTANNKQAFKVGNYHHIHNISPATKEQRDLLFSKMKEAGYEWDANKKELKKIEQNNEMVEALRTEYEKGRYDVINLTLQWLENKWPSYCDTPNIIDAYKETIKKE